MKDCRTSTQLIHSFITHHKHFKDHTGYKDTARPMRRMHASCDTFESRGRQSAASQAAGVQNRSSAMGIGVPVIEVCPNANTLSK